MQDGNGFREYLSLDHELLAVEREKRVYEWLATLPGVIVHTTGLGTRRFTVTEDAGPTAADMETNEESEALERSLLYFMEIGFIAMMRAFGSGIFLVRWIWKMAWSSHVYP